VDSVSEGRAGGKGVESPLSDDVPQGFLQHRNVDLPDVGRAALDQLAAAFPVACPRAMQ
jgi:hypothetical protein